MIKVRSKILKVVEGASDQSMIYKQSRAISDTYIPCWKVYAKKKNKIKNLIKQGTASRAERSVMLTIVPCLEAEVMKK